MPENRESPTPSAEGPLTAYSAADALKYAEATPLQPSKTEEDEEEQGAAADPDPKKEEEDEEEDAKGEDAAGEEPETDEAESETDDDEIPQLDPLLEELAKGNPKAEKRVQEIAKGLQKLKTETKELKSELEKAKPQVSFLESWNKALTDPQTAGKALEQLVLSVTQHHKTTPGQLMAMLSADDSPLTVHSSPKQEDLLPEVDEYGRKREKWERAGYASKKEAELDQALNPIRFR